MLMNFIALVFFFNCRFNEIRYPLAYVHDVCNLIVIENTQKVYKFFVAKNKVEKLYDEGGKRSVHKQKYERILIF